MSARIGLHPVKPLKMNENRTGTGSDLSEPALKMAEENRRLLEIPEERAAFVQSDLFERIEGTYDMIVSNPPYIRTEEIRSSRRRSGSMTPTGHWTEKKTGCIFTAASFQRRAVF